MKKFCLPVFVLSLLLVAQFVHASTYYVWTDQTAAGTNDWEDITSSSDGTHLAASQPGGIETSTTSGATWTTQSQSGYALASSADGTKLITGQMQGYLYISTTSGATWTAATSTGTGYWYGLASSADGTHLSAANGAPGYLYTSTTSGATWTVATSTGSRYWGGLTSSSDGSILAAIDGSPGYVYVSTTSGATWTPEINSGVRTWSAIASSADGSDLIAASNNSGGNIYISTTTGATWTLASAAGSHNWTGVASSANGQILAATAYNDDIYLSTDGGLTWTPQIYNAGAKNWFAITSSSDGTRLAAVVHGSGDIFTGVPDTIPPVVLISTPTPGQTVSGNAVTLSATSSDNVAVAGVQFYINGTPIGSQATSSTALFSTIWNSTATTSGSTYNVIAVSTDVSGNVSTSSPVTFSISNPNISAITVGSIDQNDATIAWTTDSPATSQVEYGLSSTYTSSSTPSTATTTSHSVVLSNLTAGTTYHYAVISTTPIGNIATSTDQTFTTESAIEDQGGSSGSGGGGGGSSGGGGGGSTSVGTVVNGCMPGFLFNTMTGAPCTSSTSTTLGCQPGYLFNTITGTPCSSGVTLGGAVSSVTNGSNTYEYTFLRNLTQGSRTVDVKHLQQYLNTHGYIVATSGNGSPGNETTYYGNSTMMAVMRFQRAHGITPVTGNLGPKTRAYINAHP